MDKFLSSIEAYFTQHRVEERLDELHQDVAEGKKPLLFFADRYETLTADIDRAMQAGLTAAAPRNKGFARSPALTEAAAIVRYWKKQLSSRRNRVGLARATTNFATKHSLPTEVCLMPKIIQRLHAAWKDLREVQSKADQKRQDWLNEEADAAAMKSNTDRETALRKIAKERFLKDIYKKLWPISHGHRSGALSRVKVPIADMIYCPTTDELFHHSRGAFYAHARLEPLDGDEMLFSTQRHQSQSLLQDKRVS